MPPNEPVQETVEELLSEISHETYCIHASSSYDLRMMNTHGDWWLFTFRGAKEQWEDPVAGSSLMPTHGAKYLDT